MKDWYKWVIPLVISLFITGGGWLAGYTTLRNDVDDMKEELKTNDISLMNYKLTEIAKQNDEMKASIRELKMVILEKLIQHDN